jgi:hypothetical protein
VQNFPLVLLTPALSCQANPDQVRYP